MNCKSTRFAPKTLSIKGGCTFLLSSFLITGFCSSFANSLLKIFSFLIPLPELFHEKI